MNEDPRRQQSFPLSALFVMIAVCGVIASMVGPMARATISDNIGVTDVAAASFLGSLIVMLLGAIVGLYHHRKARGAMWGILVGAWIGMVAGPTVLTPADAFPLLIKTSVAGAAMLVGVGLAFRSRALGA